MDQLPTLASDLVRLNVAVIIVSGGNAVIRAARMQRLLFPSFWEARGLILSKQVSSKALLSPPGISQALPIYSYN